MDINWTNKKKAGKKTVTHESYVWKASDTNAKTTVAEVEKKCSFVEKPVWKRKTRQMDKPDVSLHHLGMEAVGEKAIGFCWSQSPRAREHLLDQYFTRHRPNHIPSAVWLSVSHFRLLYTIFVFRPKTACINSSTSNKLFKCPYQT